MRYPSRSKPNSFSTGTDGYGVPPSVNSSHSSTPYDHLRQQQQQQGSSSSQTINTLLRIETHLFQKILLTVHRLLVSYPTELSVALGLLF